MNLYSSTIKWYWRIAIATLIEVLLFVIIYVSSLFKNPPGVGLFSLSFLLIAYVVYEAIHFTHVKITQKSKQNIKPFFLGIITVSVGSSVYAALFYCMKWIDYLVYRSEPPYLQHMILAGLIGLITSLVFVLIIFTINWKNNYYIKHIENERFKKEIAEANLLALKNQLDPHFMFNNFNTLYYLIEEDGNAAQKFLKNLSTIYRYILQNSDKATIAVMEEYQIALDYLTILKERFENCIKVKDQVDKSQLENKKIPPLVLQQLIENIIKHNQIEASMPLEISFTTVENRLIISNDLRLKKVLNKSGTGLKNIIKRFSYLTNEKVKISETDNLYTVSIPLITN